jgi:NAD(P)-dependent dehydrogenase (short-subunit alcohol dehydrogenase family)
VVLGASTGTGAVIARTLARERGLDVFAVHRGNHPEDAERLVGEIEELGRRVVMLKGDAGRHEGVLECVDALERAAGAGSVRILVHAVSGASIGHFLEDEGDAFHPKQFEKTFAYLAHSFAWWAQETVRRGLLADGARLLGLTNALHDSLLHNTGLIAPAKAALEMYVRQLAMELGPKGYRVNLLKFPTVVTPALSTVLGPEGMAQVDAAHADMIPAGRMCTLEEVADFVAALTREDAAWFNGATIDFSGGMALSLLDLVLHPERRKANR